MESVISDDSCDSEKKSMKKQLIEYGLEEENLTKGEMSDLLKALRNSKSSIQEEEVTRNTQTLKVENYTCIASPKKILKRRYLNVGDRRLPWSLFPGSLTPSEKARTLAVYIKMMSINNYRQARQAVNFAAWPPPLQIVEESTRIQPVRSTRSGRSVPVYAGFDDDSSDLDFVITKTKKRKTSNSDHNSDGVYPTKVLSLKRKSSKDENSRLIKEVKLNSESKNELLSPESKKEEEDMFSLIED